MSTSNEKRTFRIKVTTFKPSGKFYTTGEFDWHGTDCGQPGHPACYMNEVVDHIRKIRIPGGPEPVPGLIGGWAGHILLECNEGYPCLIPALPDA